MLIGKLMWNWYGVNGEEPPYSNGMTPTLKPIRVSHSFLSRGKYYEGD